MNAIAGYRFIDILPLFSTKYRCARAVKRYRIIAKAADCKSAPKICYLGILENILNVLEVCPIYVKPNSVKET